MPGVRRRPQQPRQRPQGIVRSVAWVVVVLLLPSRVRVASLRRGTRRCLVVPVDVRRALPTLFFSPPLILCSPPLVRDVVLVQSPNRGLLAPACCQKLPRRVNIYLPPLPQHTPGTRVASCTKPMGRVEKNRPNLHITSQSPHHSRFFFFLPLCCRRPVPPALVSFRLISCRFSLFFLLPPFPSCWNKLKRAGERAGPRRDAVLPDRHQAAPGLRDRLRQPGQLLLRLRVGGDAFPRLVVVWGCDTLYTADAPLMYPITPSVPQCALQL